MTPLMRAVQKNNTNCVRFLLNNTESDINGSSHTTYTPLWFAVSNGYNDIALLLLNYNASSSIVDKSISTASSISIPFTAETNLLHPEDLSGISRAAIDSVTPATYLFSPLRASIVYCRYQIMSYLLEFNANAYELFNGIKRSKLPIPSSSYNSKINDDYLNSLKFFHRQFSVQDDQINSGGDSSSKQNLEEQLVVLNEFIDDVNVYRRMLLEFIKNLMHR